MTYVVKVRDCCIYSFCVDYYHNHLFSCRPIMRWAKFCRHMRKPFTLTLYINEVSPLNFIRSLKQLVLIVIVSLHTQNTVFFYMLFSSICLWICRRLERHILKVRLVIIGGMWFLFLVYTCYGERTYILLNYSNTYYIQRLQMDTSSPFSRLYNKKDPVLSTTKPNL